MLPSKISVLVRRSPRVYFTLVATLLKARNLLYFISTFPSPSGSSSLDSFSNRRKIKATLWSLELSHYIPQETLDSLIREAAVKDDVAYSRLIDMDANFIPISFSWPGELDNQLTPTSNRATNFCQIYPGEEYGFRDYMSYLKEYKLAKYGVTFKKGGWDCFRHIEILHCGGLPIMPDISECPPLAMAHYPKNLMLLAASLIQKGQHCPDNLTQEIMLRFRERLTSSAMAKFIFSKIENLDRKNIVFLDQNFNSFPDYLSAMTLAGLKKEHDPARIIVPFGADPIYSDWQGNAEVFHGLGFGYTRILDSGLRGKQEGSVESIDQLARTICTQDILLVSDIGRNRILTNFVSNFEHPAANKIYIWGSDRAPNRRDRRWLRSLNGKVFLREQYEVK